MLKIANHPTKLLIGKNSFLCCLNFANLSTGNQTKRKTFAEIEQTEINSNSLKLVQSLIPQNSDRIKTEIPFRHSDQFWMKYSKDKQEKNDKLLPKSPYDELWRQPIRFLHQYRHKHDDMSTKDQKETIDENSLKRQQEQIENFKKHKQTREKEQDEAKTKLNKLALVLKQYGGFGMFVHIVLSLMSLGLIYVLLTMGFDINSIIKKFGFDLTATQAGMSTFMIAYTIHKLILPVRASLTVVTVPLLVRYLRKVGYFKNK